MQAISRKALRLLFVAHREEILRQGLYTFRAVLKDANFGELFVGSYWSEGIDHLFLSIQTFNSQNFTAKTAPDFYDYTVVDEFHHEAEPTYQKFLSYYQPQILLGLTATPERMDGKGVLLCFNNRIAVEIRLPEAIDHKLLFPFQYFSVTDTMDLNTLKWSIGGYDKKELFNFYTLNSAVANRRAALVVSSLLKYTIDIDEVKGLGFCVSIEHAEFMCRYFNNYGIPSIFLTGKSSDAERKTAKGRLVSGEVCFIFMVDIPEVNTVSDLEQHMLQIFYVTVWGKAAKNRASDKTQYNLYALLDSPVLLSELWTYFGIDMSKSTSLTSRWSWALTARWISTVPIAGINCWWRAVFPETGESV